MRWLVRISLCTASHIGSGGVFNSPGSTCNDRVTQVNAGRAYVRVQLAASAQGLVMQPLSQALQEYPEQKKPYADIHALTGATRPGQTVQMWARVGYAPATVLSPRRRLQDFIQA